MQFDCDIRGMQMICSIISEESLEGAVLCFAAMAPIRICHGGASIKQVGGYTEVRLPLLEAGRVHELTLEYADSFTPANRAWMPMRPYLRVGDRHVELNSSVPQGRSETSDGCSGESTQVLPATILPIVPHPQLWFPSEGSASTLGVSLVQATTPDPAVIAVCQLARRRGFAPFLTDDGLRLHVISTGIADDASGNVDTEGVDLDAYRLTITVDSVTIDAKSYGGRFYAAVTLLMLLRNCNGEIPCGIIEDRPRFAWRGQHLDTARHFYRPSTILDLLDLLALLKLNRFHWHFADDEAFRLQLECCPDLWQQTSMRGEGHLLPALFSASPEAGGSYSKADVAVVVLHAKKLNIEILPEIEMPAHALAVTQVYPDTRDPDDVGDEISVQGYRTNLVNPAMPKTWELLEAIVTEVGELFPFRHIHLGCDELPSGSWAGSPRMQELMRRENLQHQDDAVGWTMSRLAGSLQAQGLRPVAWEEAAIGSNGGIGHNAILFSWSAQGPGLAAARSGYDVVMCPAQHVYLDMAHSDDADDWGASWAAFISLDDTIAWNVIPEPELADRIIGIQGAFWSEFTSEDNQIWPMLLPRILGVASKAWQVKDPQASVLRALAPLYSAASLNISGIAQD